MSDHDSQSKRPDLSCDETSFAGDGSGIAISCHHVRKELFLGGNDEDRSLTIIPDLSLNIMHGEFVAITGPSGSGKSTLLYLMGGLDRPTSGEIKICGTSVGDMNEPDLARLRTEIVGFVYQFHFLLPEFTALENVMIPQFAAAGLSFPRAKKRATELLDLVGLGDRLNHRPNQLSGGQQQRVSIARALANDPLLLLADEPTGNLDSAASESIVSLFEELNRSQGRTILMVTHEVSLAERATRILSLIDGRIVHDDVRPPFRNEPIG